MLRHKEIFDFEQRHVSTVDCLNNSNKNFLSNNYIVDIIHVHFLNNLTNINYLSHLSVLCQHKHIRTLVASLILHKIKEVEVNPNSEETNSGCGTLAYIGIILTVLRMIIVIFLHYRKSRLCKGYRFSNAIKIILFISDIQNYVPDKIM